ncbi:MAG TPA: hypothetical protein VNJ52_08855 [Patescibacteria group bacterium]|nr:hypothetical protein [Patescibacteria group bacterium]
MSEHRWIGPALLFVGVLLMATGIAEMLRVSYIQHPGWTVVILPPVQVLLGCAFLLFPLLRRLSREAAADDDVASPGGGQQGRL